jgi:hypothetical protein
LERVTEVDANRFSARETVRNGSLRLGAAPHTWFPPASERPKPPAYTGRLMADVYWIGVFLGLGLGVGILLAGVLGGTRAGLLAAIGLAAVIGFALGIWLGDEPDAAAGALGGIFGAVSTGEIVRGALRRGGARLGTALLVAAAAVAVAVLALIPVVGYLEFLALPFLVVRLRRRQPERYAGLRTLAD